MQISLVAIAAMWQLRRQIGLTVPSDGMKSKAIFAYSQWHKDHALEQLSRWPERTSFSGFEVASDNPTESLKAKT